MQPRTITLSLLLLFLTACNQLEDASTTSPGSGGSDTLAPTGTFGVSESYGGPYQNDAAGSIEDSADARIINVAPGGKFFVQVNYEDTSGVTDIEVNLVNSSPEGLAGTLDPSRSFFTLGEPTGVSEPNGCDLSGSPKEVSCIYEVRVAEDAVNIGALESAEGEFAYVFRTKVTDAAGNTSEEAERGYVVVTGEEPGDKGDEVVDVPDPVLERVIREEVNKSDGALTEQDLAKVKELFNDAPFDSGVRSLEGLQFAVNLENLGLPFNSVSDLSPLEDLAQLVDLNFIANPITDLSPLVRNEDFAEGDFLDVTEIRMLDTCPGSGAREDIETLTERGANVDFDEPTNCKVDGGSGDGTITVTSASGAASLEGECTLRAAITAANMDTAVGGCPAGKGADTIVLTRGATYTLSEVDNMVAASSGLPAVTSEITVEGNGVTVERSAANATPDFRPLYIAGTGMLTLKDVIIQGGYLLDNGPIDGDYTAYSGGGIYNEGRLTLEEVTVQGNVGVGGGGLSNAGTALVSNSRIENNTTQLDSPNNEGGGVRNTGELELRNSIVSGNTSVVGAGIGNFGSMKIIRSAIDNNDGENTGGLYNTGTVNLEQSSISDNLTDSSRGALFNAKAGIITATDTVISGNNDDGNTLDNQGDIRFDRVTYTGNGREILNSGTMTITRSILSNNADGIDNFGAMEITNSTVSGFLLGILNRDRENATLTVAYSTIARSGTLQNNGDADAFTLVGSIIAYAESDGEPVPNCSGPVSSQGYNLSSDASCDLSQETDLLDTDPRLGALQGSGGPTRTLAPQESSPAIDAIPTDTCEVETDQRGVARPQGEACDIGAFELEQ